MDEAVELALDLGEDRGRRLLLSLGARAAVREFDKACAVRYAVHLLHERCPRVEIRNRLAQRYPFSQRTAYYCIDEALIHFCNGRHRGCETGSDNAASNTDERAPDA
jgi:hypothetical protein